MFLSWHFKSLKGIVYLKKDNLQSIYWPSGHLLTNGPLQWMGAAQCCSLRRDTQVYAVYPLGKVNHLRIPTLKSMRTRNNIVLWQTFHKFIHKFTQSVLWSTGFLIITPHFCWRLLVILKWTNKGDMKWTTPFQCFRKPAAEAANSCEFVLWVYLKLF